MTFIMAMFKYSTNGTIHEKKIDKPNFIKTKNFCSSEDDVKWMRRQDKVGETICKNVPDKGLLSKTHKTLKTQQ